MKRFATILLLGLAALSFSASLGAMAKPVKLTSYQRQRMEAVQAPMVKTLLELPPVSLIEGQPMGLHAVMAGVQAASPQLALNQEQVAESKLKFHRVATKRLLFVFKYLNASYLEGAAFNDIKASEAQAAESENAVLYGTAATYYQWVRAYAGRLLGYESIQQGLGQLRLNQSYFDSGEGTSFDVLETEHQLLDRHRLYVEQEAQTQLLLAAMKAQLPSGHPFLAAAKVYPEGLSLAKAVKGEARLSVPEPQLAPLSLIPAGWTEAKVLALATEHRPASEEAHYRLASLQQLVKAASYDFDKRQGEFLVSTLKQAAQKQRLVEQQVQQEARAAWLQYRLLQQQKEVASQQLLLAKRFHQQRLVSQQAGFANNTDVLQSQVLLSEALLKTVHVQADVNLQQLKLLQVLGLLKDAWANPALLASL